MKKLVLAITIALFGVTSLGTVSAQGFDLYAQKKDNDKKKDKKDPPGPPVVRDKEPKGKGDKPHPKRDKRPPDF